MTLETAYGPRGWWPLPSRAGLEARDADGYLDGPSETLGPGGGRERSLRRFEIVAAALLAQNTAWTGAARALLAMAAHGCLDPIRVSAAPIEELEAMLRPSGTFRLKARYLRSMAQAWSAIDAGTPERSDLLCLPGIGPETADCILVYCYSVPVFIADAYARRVLSRLGLLPDGLGYEAARLTVEPACPTDAAWQAEAHALLVEHAKRHCRARPLCPGCPLRNLCEY
ncbi:MAG: DNA repair protein [Spirochaetales bacterium]|nr:DNA repair protein [Spirochaetales bacterium]